MWLHSNMLGNAKHPDDTMWLQEKWKGGGAQDGIESWQWIVFWAGGRKQTNCIFLFQKFWGDRGRGGHTASSSSWSPAAAAQSRCLLLEGVGLCARLRRRQTYLVDENIQRGVDGAPFAAGHWDKSEAHADVEPLAEAGARQDLRSSPVLLLGGLGGVLSATFTRPSWNKRVEEEEEVVGRGTWEAS